MRGPCTCWDLGIGEPGVFQEPAEAGVLPTCGIRGDPGEGQRACLSPQDHGAWIGQVELAVDQGVASGGGIGGEDADLTVLGAAGGAGVFALHPGGGGALFDESRVVDDQGSVGGAEMFGDVCLYVIADLVGLPATLGQYVLQSVRSAVFPTGDFIPPS